MGKTMISIVIPVYKKSDVVQKSIKDISSVLNTLNVDYELIAVVDGSPDDSFSKLMQIIDQVPQLKIVNLSENLGKGGAVRVGFSQAQGDYIGMIDCGLDINPLSLVRFIETFRLQEVPVLIASKYHSNSIYYSNLRRRLFSGFFIVLRKFLFNLNVADTQTGLKFFRKDVIKALLPFLKEDKWLWDIEILALCQELNIEPIKELPVLLNMNTHEQSESTRIKSIVTMFFNLIGMSFRIGRLAKLLQSRAWFDLTSKLKLATQ